MKYHSDVYKKDKYENPFYKRGVELNKSGILLVIFLIIASYWFYLVFYSPYFKITQVIVNNLEYADERDVQTFVLRALSGRKIIIFKQDRGFLLNKEKLRDEIMHNFFIENVEIKNVGLNCLEINIDEKKSRVTWVSRGKYYYLDIDGIIKKEVPPLEVNRNYLIIYDGNEKKTNNINEKVIPCRYVQRALEICDNIKKDTNLEIISFTYFEKDSPEIHAKTNKGFELYFDLNSDIGEQLNNFYIISKELKEQSVNYVDLRFGKRIYLK